jgi:hypothetical protein
MPAAGKCLGYAAAHEPGKWIVFASGMMPVQPTLNDGGKSIVWEGDAGDYAVIYLPPGDGQPVVLIYGWATQWPFLGETGASPDRRRHYGLVCRSERRSGRP